MPKAPIALFVYNRPVHTQLTIEALKKNKLAQESSLVIFSDAPKSKAQVEDVNKVRQYIHQVDGFKSIDIVERKTNFGLAQSIIDGVTSLVNEYGRVIVLEDDLVVSPFFLDFMNEALIFYENNPKVMHISGCRYPVEKFGNDETFFLRVPLCWGWATWQRAWTFYNKDISVMNKFNRKMINDFNFNNTYNYWLQLILNKSGKLNTWFVFWYATLFLQQGLTLFPAQSLVQNIGMDNSGTNSGNTNMYDIDLSLKPVKIFDIPCIESNLAYEMHKQYFKRFNVSIYKRIIRKVLRMIGLQHFKV